MICQDPWGDATPGICCVNLMNSEFRLLLEQQIARLEARLFDLQAQMPAHSVSPTLVAQIDEIDDQLESLRLQLATHQDRPESGQE